MSCVVNFICRYTFATNRELPSKHGRTIRCSRPYWCDPTSTPPRLDFRRPSFPQACLGWNRCVRVMSVWSKGVEKRHLDPWAHLYVQPTATPKQSRESLISGSASHSQIKRYGHTYKASNPLEPTEDTDSQPIKEWALGPSTKKGDTS
jgi:hypothetical protein